MEDFDPYRALYTGFQAGSQYRSPYEDFQRQMLSNVGQLNSNMMNHYNRLEQDLYAGRIPPELQNRVREILTANREQFHQGVFTPAMGKGEIELSNGLSSPPPPPPAKQETTYPYPIGPQFTPTPTPPPVETAPPSPPPPPPPLTPAKQRQVLRIDARTFNEAFGKANQINPRPDEFYWNQSPKGKEYPYNTRRSSENRSAWRKKVQPWQPPNQAQQ